MSSIFFLIIIVYQISIHIINNKYLVQVLYLQTATKCMLCEERNRSVTLGPCNHFVLCNQCVDTIKDCPYCSTPILSHTNTTTTQA